MNTKLALIGIATVTAASAHAGVLSISGMGPNYEILTINYLGSNSTVYVGPQLARYDGGPEFEAYCLSLGFHNNLPTSYDTATFADTGLFAKTYQTYGHDAPDSQWAAAVQLALWDVAEDGGDGLSAGVFKVNSPGAGIASKVATILGTDYSAITANATIYNPTSHGQHHTLYQAMIGQPDAVPEPASLAVLGLGIGAFIRRRKAQRA